MQESLYDYIEENLGEYDNDSYTILTSLKHMYKDMKLAKSEDALDIDVFTADIENVLTLIDKLVSDIFINRNLTYVDDKQWNRCKADILLDYMNETRLGSGNIER